ncbi:hypothetical protein PGB90_005457 [Kerria lacca]
MVGELVKFASNVDKIDGTAVDVDATDTSFDAGPAEVVDAIREIEFDVIGTGVNVVKFVDERLVDIVDNGIISYNVFVRPPT